MPHERNRQRDIKIYFLLPYEVWLLAVMRLAGGQGDFGSSVNPIPTMGAIYAHHITVCPPGFENLTESLYSTRFNDSSKHLYSKYHILEPTMP